MIARPVRLRVLSMNLATGRARLSGIAAPHMPPLQRVAAEPDARDVR